MIRVLDYFNDHKGEGESVDYSIEMGRIVRVRKFLFIFDAYFDLQCVIIASKNSAINRSHKIVERKFADKKRDVIS